MKVAYRSFIFLLCLALVPAGFAQESRFYNRGKAAFEDELYEVAEKQFRELIEKHPTTSRREEAILLWAQSLIHLDRWEEAARILKAELGSPKPPRRYKDGYVFWLGEAYSQGKQYSEAEKRYREVIDTHSGSPYAAQAQYGLAWALYRTDRTDEALALFSQLAAFSDKPRKEVAQKARLDMGQVYLELRQFDRAREVFEPIANKEPVNKFNFIARYWLGQTAYAQKQYEEALTQLEQIVNQPKVSPPWLEGEAWSSIGWIYWHQSDFEKSAQAFEKAFETLENEKKKRESAIQFGQCYLRLGKIDTALEKMKDFVKANPSDALAPEVQLAIADIYFSQNRFEEAALEYGRLITNYPQNAAVPIARYGRGWSLLEQKKYDESVQEFQQAAANTSDSTVAADAMYKIGDVYYVTRQFEKSITAYQIVVEKYPGSSHLEQALFQILQAQLNLGNITAAEAALSKLIEAFPNSRYRDESYLQIGLAYVNQGLYTAARKLYETFLKNHPTSPLAQKAILDLGQSYYLEALYAEALEQFNKIALDEYPLQPDLVPIARYYRGRCFYQMNETDKAIKEFTELVEKYKDAPVTPEVQFRIGEFFFNRKNFPEAQRQFELLQKNYPQSQFADVALYWAGRAAYQRQGYKEALELFEKLIKNYPQSRWCADARFWQGDTLIEQGGADAYNNALLVFNQFIRDYKDSDLVDEAWGRYANCQATLQRYQEAIVSYQNVVDSPTATISQRNQALFEIGVCYENLNRTDDAFQQYMRVIYDQVANPDPKQPAESMWFCRAGLAAAAIKKRQDEWREAMKIYQRMVEANVSCSQEAQEQARSIAETKLLPF